MTLLGKRMPTTFANIRCAGIHPSHWIWSQYQAFIPCMTAPGTSGATIGLTILTPVRDPWGTFYNRGKIMLCDPRAVLVKEDGVVVYHPRMNVVDLSREVRKWLDANPEWGGPDGVAAYSYRVKVN